MASKLIILCALIVASAQADFSFFHNSFPAFEMPPMPEMPKITFPPMPKFTFPPMPKITFPPMPKMPSMEEIEERSKTDPNTVYNKVVVSSSSSMSTDGTGKVVKKGNTKIYSNNNGDVHEVEFGLPATPKKAASTETPKDKPKMETPEEKPKAETPEENPKTETPEKKPKVTPIKKKIPKMKMIKHKFPKWKPLNLNNNIVSSFSSSNFNDGGIGFQSSFSSFGGGGIHSSSSSSSSSSSNINGVVTGSGMASKHYNVNGETGGETIFYSV